MIRSSLQTAVDQLLGDDTLDRFVRSRRLEGLSWRKIADDLFARTAIPVTHETLRAWFPGDVEPDEIPLADGVTREDLGGDYAINEGTLRITPETAERMDADGSWHPIDPEEESA